MERLFDETPHHPSVDETHAGAAPAVRHQFPAFVRDGVEDDDPSKWAHGIGLRSEGSSSASTSSASGYISPLSDDPFRHSPELGGGRPADVGARRLMDDFRLFARLGALHVQDEGEVGIRQPSMRFSDVSTRSPVEEEHSAFRRSLSLLDEGERRAFESDCHQSCCFGPNLLDLNSSVAAHQSNSPFLYPNGPCGDSQYPYSNGHLGVNSFLWSIRDQDLASYSQPLPTAEDYLQSQQNEFDPITGFYAAPRSLSSFSNDRSNTRGSPINLYSAHSPRVQCPPLAPPKYDNLIDKECIYQMAQDQDGCRFLQEKFDEREPREINVIFNAIIDHVAELMVNPFGNYLIQKLLDVCSEEQKMLIILVLIEDPAALIRISMNTHGTRAVQKLIETLKTRQHILLAIAALKPGFLDLIKDLNGNHVVQRCLQVLPTEYNKIIIDLAAKHCVEIATHRHGCVVVQRCIDFSTGEHRAKLVLEISNNGYLLAQDAFGNYVVQYILGLGNPSATANLISQFEANYVHLSTQKFSSNVVEKCLKVFREQDQARIIAELLSVQRFDQLMQDPFANYVIQSALKNTKGSLHDALARAIRPHAADLRTNPYCKRIFSRHG